eukprot:6193129-Lingulodinium_polyedra.AAC.1
MAAGGYELGSLTVQHSSQETGWMWCSMLATSPEGGLWQCNTNAGTPLHTMTWAVASAARKKD